MKNLVLSFVLMLSAFSLSAKELKVLMIGNSFSISVVAYLPAIVKAEKKHQLLLASMFIGGCSMERHLKELAKSEADPNHTPYRTNYADRKNVSLPKMITAEKWDIVTIQESSSNSWIPGKMLPYADQLVAYIRKHAPQAEIVIQQTWSCRVPLAEPTELVKRYEILKKNYADIANKYGLRVIPVGDAVQIFRQRYPVTIEKVDLKNYTYPNLPGPDFSGDPAYRYLWTKNRKTGKYFLWIDDAHLCPKGVYMQACIWYGFLFGENPNEIKYCPKSLDPKLAEAFRSCSAEALENYKQVNKK